MDYLIETTLAPRKLALAETILVCIIACTKLAVLKTVPSLLRVDLFEVSQLGLLLLLLALLVGKLGEVVDRRL